MKKTLNKFAIWLYRKTKPQEKFNAQQTFMGMKVLVSDNLPTDTILMGSRKYKHMLDSITYEQMERS